MIVPAIIEKTYNELLVKINLLKNKVNPILIKYCENNNYAYSQRIKSLESLSEKIESGRFDCLDNISDIWASTIIIPTFIEEESVLEFISNTFKIIDIKKRGSTKKPPEVFRFDSTRIICEYISLPSVDTIFDNLHFEIQIKSAFEHAWAVTSHSISYKSDRVDWRMLRLVSQMKSSVEQLDLLAVAYEDIFNTIPRSDWPELDVKEKIIELWDSIKTLIPEEMVPKDLSRFCNNIITLIKNKDNNRFHLENNTNKAIKIIEKHFNQIKKEEIPHSLSAFQYICCILVDNNYFNNLNFEKYILVTEEMIGLFPKVKNIEKKFTI